MIPVDQDNPDGPAPPWAPKELSAKHCAICEYHLAGASNREIALMMGMHEVSVGLVLRSPIAREYLANRLNDLNGELRGQFRQVVRNMEEFLKTDDKNLRLRATDMWFRSQGRYAPKAAAKDGPVSAEEVVSKLLERATNVEINVDNRTQIAIRDDEPPPGPDDYSFLGDGK